MLNGTKKLFPTDYKRFKEVMLEAAEEGELPVVLQLNSPGKFNLEDFRDAFLEFQYDTGLNITGEMFICPDCGELHVTVTVDHMEEQEERLLQ